MVDQKKRDAVQLARRERCSELQSEGLRKGFGTEALGNIDNVGDGDKTKRRRRKVIVLRQRRGMSLDMTLQ